MKLDFKEFQNYFKYKGSSNKIKISKSMTSANYKLSSNLSNTSSKVRSITSTDVNKSTRKPLYSVGSIVLSLIIGMIILAMMGTNPFHLITGLFKGSFGGTREFGNFLATFSWMLALGLALGVSFKAGLFNIGASSQMMISGMIGYLFAFNVSGLFLGWFWAVFFGVLMATMLALVIGVLKTRFNINEVLSSIMFNWIIFLSYKMILDNPAYSDGAGGTMPIAAENSLRTPWLSDIFPDSTINIGIFLVLIAFFMVWGIYKYTPFGYKSELIGANENAAKYAGINNEKTTLKTFALSGALAGLAGSIFYLGVNESLPVVTDNIPNEGFQGITIALIGFNSPIGIFGASIFMAMLINSSMYLSTIVDPNFIGIIQGLTIFLIAISHFFIAYDPIEKYKTKKLLRDGNEISDLDKLSKAKELELEIYIKSSSKEFNILKQKKLKKLYKYKRNKLNYDNDITEEINLIYQEYKKKIKEESFKNKNSDELKVIINKLLDQRQKEIDEIITKTLKLLEKQEEQTLKLKLELKELEDSDKKARKAKKETILNEIKEINSKIKSLKIENKTNKKVQTGGDK